MQLPGGLDDRQTAVLRIRPHASACIIKNIFLLESVTNMKRLAPMGLRRAGWLKISREQDSLNTVVLTHRFLP